VTGPAREVLADLEVAEAVAAGRLVLERRVASPSAADFYAYRWLLDGGPVPARLQAALDKALAEGRVVAGPPLQGAGRATAWLR
jgi:hypothetical protein